MIDTDVPRGTLSKSKLNSVKECSTWNISQVIILDTNQSFFEPLLVSFAISKIYLKSNYSVTSQFKKGVNKCFSRTFLSISFFMLVFYPSIRIPICSTWNIEVSIPYYQHTYRCSTWNIIFQFLSWSSSSFSQDYLYFL